MRGNDLKRSFQVEAKSLAPQFGLNRVVFGKSPAIDLRNKILYLPQVPLSIESVKAENLKLKFRRWLAHEIGGHARFTDPELSARFKEELEEHPKLWHLFMCVEDPRIEQCYSGVYAGARLHLDEGLQAMIEDEEVRDGTRSPWDALECFVLTWGRVFYMGQDFVEPLYQKARNELVKHLDEEGVEEMETLLSTKVYGAKSSEDALNIAQDILVLMEEIAERQEQENQSSESDSDESEDGDESDSGSDESGNDSDSDESEDGDESDSGSDESDSDSNSDNEEDDGGQGEDSDEGDSASGASAGSEDDDADEGPSARSVLNSTPEDTTPDDATNSFAQELDEVLEEFGSSAEDGGTTAGGAQLGSDGESTTPVDDNDRYRELRESLSGQVAQLRNKITAVLMERKRGRRVNAVAGPRHSRKNLWSAKAGNPAIYQRKIVQPLPKARLSLLCDLSGSMYGHEIEIAEQVITALSEVLHQVDTPYELLGFGGSNSHPAGLVEIKSFHQTFHATQGAVGGMIQSVGGGTPMAEGMLEAGMRLAVHPEENKLLFVITDGAPNNRMAAQEMAEHLAATGITTVGVGIKSDAGQALFDRWATVHTVDDLGDAILTSLYECLVGEAA